MKIVLLVFTAAFLYGCGGLDRAMVTVTGNATRTCFDGVLYLQFTSGATVAYNKDGTIRTCND